jgi:hypothetical protein
MGIEDEFEKSRLRGDVGVTTIRKAAQIIK